MASVLNKNESISQEDINKINPYLFCTWLSGNPITIFAANALNRYYNIPISCQYKMIKAAFAGKIKYIKYPKGGNQEKNENVNLISQHYNISIERAEEYNSLISNEELQFLHKIHRKQK